MGPGALKADFADILSVLDWLRVGVVLVHKDTKALAKSNEGQGAQFISNERNGEYFYLCHGNQNPSVVFLGQFLGPANLFCSRGDGWAEREFRWIRTAVVSKKYKGKAKWWTPNHNSTFASVPHNELGQFEEKILIPFFELRLREFGIRNQ
ncbi:MAG: hypothetical protein Tsb009_07510 [Planctomycetaceae bacterium]